MSVEHFVGTQKENKRIQFLHLIFSFSFNQQFQLELNGMISKNQKSFIIYFTIKRFFGFTTHLLTLYSRFFVFYFWHFCTKNLRNCFFLSFQHSFFESDDTEITKNLPREILLRIFSFLDVISLCRCAQVSECHVQINYLPLSNVISLFNNRIYAWCIYFYI